MDSYSAAGPTGVIPSVEIQREIDAMKVVYTQELGTLQSLVREVDDEVQRLRSQARTTNTGREVDAADGQVPKQVLWRLENLGSDWDSMRELFAVEECPQVEFSLMLFRTEGGGTDAASASSSPGPQEGATTEQPCRLVLQVAGPATEGLLLSVSLSIGLEELPVCDGPSNGPRLAVKSEELRGVGEVSCDAVLPVDISNLAVVCCAELMVLSWEAEPLCFSSVWLQQPAAKIERPSQVLRYSTEWMRPTGRRGDGPIAAT